VIDSLPTAETLTVEFKADRTEPLKDRDLALAALCLANALGGTLYLGIEDNGTVTGLHPTRDRRKNLAAVIAEGTTPPRPVSVECLELNDLAVLQIDVPVAQGTVFSRDGRCQIRSLDQQGKPICRPASAVDVMRRSHQQLELDWSAEPLLTTRRRDLLQAFGLEENQATHALQLLGKRGALIPEGVGKGRTFRLPSAV